MRRERERERERVRRERDLWCRAWISVDSSEVVEADVDKDIVAIEDVESKDERVLDTPEVGDDVHVERPHNSSYSNQNQTETELVVWACRHVLEDFSTLLTY